MTVSGCHRSNLCSLATLEQTTRLTIMVVLVNTSPSVPASIHNNQSKRFPDSTRSRPIDFSVPEAAWI